jgi:hypothetical protein
MYQHSSVDVYRTLGTGNLVIQNPARRRVRDQAPTEDRSCYNVLADRAGRPHEGATVDEHGTVLLSPLHARQYLMAHQIMNFCKVLYVCMVA